MRKVFANNNAIGQYKCDLYNNISSNHVSQGKKTISSL